MLSQQLQVFLQVADSGSFSKAAQRLFVTPASVMKQINALERRLGLTLLIRNNQGVSLTAAGRSLYEDGLKLRAYAADAVTRAKQAGGRDLSLIHISLYIAQNVHILWEQPIVTRRIKLRASLGGRNTRPSALSIII